MSQAKRLSKIKFYSISRDIRDGRRSNVEMADFHGVSTGTIRTVRVSKTWKGFEEHKKAVVAKALQRKVELGKTRAAAHGVKLTESVAGSGEEDMVTITRSHFNALVLLDKRVRILEDRSLTQNARLDALDTQLSSRRGLFGRTRS